MSLSKASEGPWERSRNDAFTGLKPEECAEKCTVLEILDSPSRAHFRRWVGRSRFDDSLLLNSSLWAVPSGKGGEILFHLPGCLVPQGLGKRLFFFFFLVRGFSEVLVQFPKEGGSVWMEDKVETKAVSARPCSLFPGFLPGRGM